MTLNLILLKQSCPCLLKISIYLIIVAKYFAIKEGYKKQDI